VKLDANFSGSRGETGIAGACDFCPSGAPKVLHFATCNVGLFCTSQSVRQRQTPFSLKYAFSQISFFIARARFNYSNYGFCGRHLSLNPRNWRTQELNMSSAYGDKKCTHTHTCPGNGAESCLRMRIMILIGISLA